MFVSVDLVRLREHAAIIEDELKQIRSAQDLLRVFISDTLDLDTLQNINFHLKSAKQIEEMILERKKMLEIIFEEMSDLRMETGNVLEEGLKRINEVAVQKMKGNL